MIAKEKIIMGHDNTAEVLNTFFSTIVRNLMIERYSNCDPLANNINDPVLKCNVKHRNHPSMLATGKVCNKNRKRHSQSDISNMETTKIR